MLALDFSKHKLIGNFYDPPHKVYFRQDPLTGDLLVGGMRLLEEESENSDFDKTTPVIQNALAQFIRSIQSFDSKYDIGRATANDNQNFANFTAQENQGKRRLQIF
jgi:hypothetical protein